MAWIKYDYPVYYDNRGNLRQDNPSVEVEISYQGKTKKYLALIDSGAQATNIDMEIAKSLGIDLTKATPASVEGAGSTSGSRALAAQCDIKISKQLGSINIFAVFAENLSFPVILGQKDFFEKFDVKFEKRNNRFFLDRINIPKE